MNLTSLCRRVIESFLANLKLYFSCGDYFFVHAGAASSRELDLVSNAKKIFFGLEMSFFFT